MFLRNVDIFRRPHIVSVIFTAVRTSGVGVFWVLIGKKLFGIC